MAGRWEVALRCGGEDDVSGAGNGRHAPVDEEARFVSGVFSNGYTCDVYRWRRA